MSDSPATGSIYDLGYQRYHGIRLGRRHAIWALYLHSLKNVFGIGRSFWAKASAFGILALALIPAVVQLGIASIAPADLEVVAPEDYYEIIQPLLAVFCAIVAPELGGRDQRTNTLSLYFSRALLRDDYALAKFGALVTGMLSITVIPQLLMFIGNASAADKPFDYLTDYWQDIPAILASASLLSCLVAAIGMAIASQTPRRAYSTVGILAAFILVSAIAASIFEAADNDTGRLVLLLSPFHTAVGFTLWIFNASPDTEDQFARADLPGIAYATSAVSFTLIALGLLLQRYRRLSP